MYYYANEVIRVKKVFMDKGKQHNIHTYKTGGLELLNNGGRA